MAKQVWGLGIGDWGLGIGPNPQSPSPIPNPHFYVGIVTKYLFIVYFYKIIF